MAELRCPMCGKANPAEREVCAYCGARLKPLIAQTPAGGSPAPEDRSQSVEGAYNPFEAEEESGWPADSGGEVPDWLQSLRPETGEPGSFEAESEAILGETDLPDWLSGPAPSEGGLSESSQMSEPEDGGSSDLPDWLASFGASEGPGEQDESIEAEEPLEEGGMPEWLMNAAMPPEASTDDLQADADRGTSSEEDEPGAEGGQAYAFDEQAELPVDEASHLPEEASSHPSEAEPGWLRRIRSQPVESEPPQGAQPPLGAGEAETPAFPLPESPSEAEPESARDPWLAGLAAAAAVSSISGEDTEAEAIPADEPEFDLDWLKDEAGSELTEETTYGNVAPFSEGFEEEAGSLEEAELPAWLMGAKDLPGGTEALPAQEEETPTAGDLAAASLPGWLAALRPVESAASPPPEVEAPEAQVSSGPLAGLKGILPAEPEISRAKRAPAYSVKLQVAEAQAAHAQLFTDLIEAEGAVQRLPGRAAVSSPQVMRLLVFLILLAAVLWPVLIRSESTPLPFYTDEINAAGQAINALPAGAPVLLAVDFEPGFSGELEGASGAVVDHLMRQGAYLALVSTTPTGALQGERLLSGLNLSGGYRYNGLDRYANLGFIPGGPAGLRSFAETPSEMLPFALSSDGGAADRVWKDTPLGGVERLSDFALAVVLTENPDTARTWIEQAGPMLAGTPLILVSSAQAEPLIRPYYGSEAGQVQGLVSGLAGGAAYERWVTRDGPARQAWDAYTFALPVAVVLIVLGTLLTLLSNSMTSRRRTRRAASSRR